PKYYAAVCAFAALIVAQTTAPYSGPVIAALAQITEFNMSNENRVLLEEIRDLLKQQNSLIASIAETNKRAQEDNAKSFIATDSHLKRSEKLKAAEVRNNLIFLCFVIFIILFAF